ncbi:YhbY family RNA-binding protein [Candidatus Woesearchaeota archaeon]|nr:YhbY family RNA-binding protein [Candidatus Woesearchaeota archaeon]
MDLNELKVKAHSLEPVIRIGKNGISDTTIKEIVTVLKKRNLIKIKLFKSSLETKNRKQIAKEIADKTGSNLVQVTGFIIVLYKR